MIYVYFFIQSLTKLSRNSVRFENSSGNWLSDGLNPVRFYLTVRDMTCMQLLMNHTQMDNGHCYSPFLPTANSPLYTGGLFHCYMLDESISHFRGVGSNMSL